MDVSYYNLIFAGSVKHLILQVKQNPFFTRKDFFIEIPDKKHPYFGCKVTVFFIQKNFFFK